MVEEKIEFNYVVINRDNKDYIVRVLEPITYKKIELDPSEAYTPAFIPNGMNISNYPGLFNIDNIDNIDNNDKFISPQRKVLCHIGKCDFCNKIVGSNNIRQEYTDIDNHLGYFYCDTCEDVFTETLKRTGMRSIWYLRDRKTKEDKYNIWVPRTRRDQNGNKINYGPYIFEKWMIYGWYAYDYNDDNGISKPHVVCDNGILNKLVPVDVIQEINPENDIEYNPNNDLKWK
jgi:hypothetical protein